MELNIREVPLSIAGSWFSFVVSDHELWLLDLHTNANPQRYLFKVLFDGYADPYDQDFLSQYQFRADVGGIVCRRLVDQATCFLALTGADGVQCRSTGIAVTLIAVGGGYNTFYQLTTRGYEYISYDQDRRYCLAVDQGAIHVNAPWAATKTTTIRLTSVDSEPFALQIQSYQTALKSSSVQGLTDIDALQTQHRQVFAEFLRRGNWATGDHSVQLAAYLLWANQVTADGILGQSPIYMTKFTMNAIWSWDNAFSALGVAPATPALAYAQFKLFYSHQADTGAYPDMLNNRYESFGCVKPPIHAWLYDLIRQHNAYFDESKRLLESYHSIAKNTLFWLEYRRQPETNLLYYSHGNDSGWDNTSSFEEGAPIASPDLVAYLIKQCGILASWAIRVAPDEATDWQMRHDDLLTELMTRYYDANTHRFKVLNARTGIPVTHNSSLLSHMVLVIASELPSRIVQDEIASLEKHFRAPYGLCTEAHDSRFYRPGSYWRGPIWAPNTYLLIAGLTEAGQVDYANQLAEQFVRLVSGSSFWENYDPYTGEGNDSAGFSWTAAVYLTLVKKLEQDTAR